jgi:hypothetical protein
LESGPWQAKQLFDKIGRTWLLKEIFSAPGDGVAGFCTGVFAPLVTVGSAGAAACSGDFLQDANDQTRTAENKIDTWRFISLD